MTRIAVVGLGRMGGPIASRLVAAGFEVAGYDVRPDVAPAGVLASASASEAARGASAVLTVLPGTPELRALMLDDGLLDRLDAGTAWIDCTSTTPDVADELTARAGECGVIRVDCGLGGGPRDAAAGTLTLYVGGPPDVLDRFGTLFAALAEPGGVQHLGPTGTGTLAKLLVNLLWFGQATLVGEALLLARSAGLDPARLAQILPGTPAASAFVTQYLPALMDGDYLASFGLDRVVEELDGLERLAGQRRSPYEVADAVGRVHREALERFGAVGGELLAVAHLEHLAGSPLHARPEKPCPTGR